MTLTPDQIKRKDEALKNHERKTLTKARAQREGRLFEWTLAKRPPAKRKPSMRAKDAWRKMYG